MSTRGSTANREPRAGARDALRAGAAFGFAPAVYPSVDDVDFDELFSLEELAVDTEDGWRLVITRYRPVPQPFPQPLFGVPLLLVHGYTQNRRAWNAGEFVKNM